tara:strand:+ start:13462 stop:13608 length:147 start_codon:yes stop_codon:yes gene_type:complete
MTDDVMDNLIRLGKEVERNRIRMLVIVNKNKAGFTFDDLIELINEEQS